jgi:uncharacterized protein (TIGR02271 family)
MSRTLTALFDTRADAEAGRQRLLDARLDADHVRIHDKSSIGEAGYSSHSEPGMWASIKNAFLPDEDRHIYEEGVRRGGFLLTADIDEHQADEAVRALDHANVNSIDIDQRSAQWRAEGWTPPVAGAALGGAAPSAGLAASAAGATTTATTAGSLSSQGIGQSIGHEAHATGTAGDTQRIQLVEEQLVVGKREVERGGVRVRSYVTEQPVQEQIRLRSERVSVQRTPVDRPVTGDAFQERSIEMTQTDEEAVVAKTARVVEEVVISKSAEERVEEINDTVRHTEIDIERLDGTEAGLTRDGTGLPKK